NLHFPSFQFLLLELNSGSVVKLGLTLWGTHFNVLLISSVALSLPHGHTYMSRCLAWSLATPSSPNPQGEEAGPTASPNTPCGCHTLPSSGLSSSPLMTSLAIWPTLLKLDI
ncbi:mCG1029230, partial [Mus musculus]